MYDNKDKRNIEERQEKGGIIKFICSYILPVAGVYLFFQPFIFPYHFFQVPLGIEGFIFIYLFFTLMLTELTIPFMDVWKPVTLFSVIVWLLFNFLAWLLLM